MACAVMANVVVAHEVMADVVIASAIVPGQEHASPLGSVLPHPPASTAYPVRQDPDGLLVDSSALCRH